MSPTLCFHRTDPHHYVSADGAKMTTVVTYTSCWLLPIQIKISPFYSLFVCFFFIIFFTFLILLSPTESLELKIGLVLKSLFCLSSTVSSYWHGYSLICKLLWKIMEVLFQFNSVKNMGNRC